MRPHSARVGPWGSHKGCPKCPRRTGNDQKEKREEKEEEENAGERVAARSRRALYAGARRHHIRCHFAAPHVHSAR